MHYKLTMTPGRKKCPKIASFFMTFYAASPPAAAAAAAAAAAPEESFCVCEMVLLIEHFIILVSKDGMEGNRE